MIWTPYLVYKSRHLFPLIFEDSSSHPRLPYSVVFVQVHRLLWNPSPSKMADKTTPSTTAPINKGDAITTDITETSNKITVTWTQGFKKKAEEYHSGEYNNTTKSKG